MSRYKDYSAADFAWDEYFQKWVLTPDEYTNQFWTNIMENHPDKKSEIEEAIQLVRLSGLSTEREANEAYLAVWKNVSTHATQEKFYKSTRKLQRYAAVAAAVTAILTTIYMLRTGRGDALTYKTDYGESKEVTLEDGTTVMLNANSSLRISGSWEAGKSREVFLQGEAFFDVVKTADKKTFTVKIPGDIIVQVLGTSFSVNTRRDNRSVYLQSGKVTLNVAGDMIILRPGERADYEKSQRKMIVSRESPRNARDKLAWRENLYVMNDVSLTSVVSDMEDNFGKQVIILDSTLATKSVTAKVPARDINVWVKVLSETLEIKIEQTDRQIIIGSKK
jgi:ferric-dicitrate binding protein FerR (iron transport regulator)